MSETMRWLLGLRLIPADAEQLRITWEYPVAAWIWPPLILLCIGFAIWSYSRMEGAKRWRMALASVRGLMILFILIILAGPMLELPRERIERDWVLVLVDRSASMTIADVEDPLTGQRVSREEQLREVLAQNRAVFRELADERNLVWLGYHSGAFALETADEAGALHEDRTDDAEHMSGAIPLLDEPTGQRTRISTAMSQALQRAAARPLSGIVLLSDGRTDDPPARAVIRRLAADRIPVYTVPMGSAEPIGDLAVGRIEHPQRAFVRDKVPINVEIERIGAPAADMPMTVRIVDRLTGEELDAMNIEAGDQRDEVTLTVLPDLAGEQEWEIIIDTEQPDLIPENNRKLVMIDLVDRPIKALYVEGYTRWEYHYIKSLLVREETIESSILLLSADREFAQEGDIPITRMPRTEQEFSEYDVIIIGDVPGTFFSSEQLMLLADHVGRRGAGLLWIGGERYTPSTYGGTMLSDLLPMRGSLTLSPIDRNINMAPTMLADRLGVLQLTTDQGAGWPEELVDPSYVWSQLRWAQRLNPAQLKPTAEVLAETVTTFDDGLPLPLVTLMRYGAGRTIYVATDEIWRWRFGRGESLTQQFWVQLIRMLGRESLSGAGQALVMRVNPRRVEVSQPIRVEVQLLDSQLVDTAPRSIRAAIETLEGETVTMLELTSTVDEPDRYAATYLPDITGELRVRLDDPLIDDDSQAYVDVFTPDDELRRPETDHTLLAEISESTGGRMLSDGSLQELSGLPRRQVRTENPLAESIWDSPLTLLIALLLLTLEWIGRKAIRLV